MVLIDSGRWYNNPCHASVADTRDTNPAVSLEETGSRYRALESLGLDSADSIELAESPLLDSLRQKVLGSELNKHFPKLRTLLLALLGWSVPSEGDAQDRLCCQYCTRTVGLWNFRTSAPDSNKEPLKRSLADTGAPEVMPAFDPIHEHYWHCSWCKIADCNSSNTEDSLSELGAWRVVSSSLSEVKGPDHLIFSPDKNASIEV